MREKTNLNRLFEIGDKSGFELAISTIVLLILAIAVLVLLFLFLTMGSNNFMDTLKSYFSYSNVDAVVNSCNFFSSSNMQYKYCCERQVVRYYLEDKKVQSNFTCSELLNKSFVSNMEQFSCGGLNC